MSAAGRVAAGERTRPPRYLHSARGSRYETRRGQTPVGERPGALLQLVLFLLAGPQRVHDRAGHRPPRRGPDAAGGRADRLGPVALPRFLDELSAGPAAPAGGAARAFRRLAAGLAGGGGGGQRGGCAAGLPPRAAPRPGDLRAGGVAGGGERDGVPAAPGAQPTRAAAVLR